MAAEPNLEHTRGSPQAAPSIQPGPSSWWRRCLAAAEAGLDVVFPPVCAGCGGLVEAEGILPDRRALRHVCATCARRVLQVGPPHCDTCGYPFFGAGAETRGCPHCAMLKPAFREGRTATLLQGALRDLVHALKYGGSHFVLHDLGVIAGRNTHFCGFIAGAVLVPVPLHPRKRRERGFNQAELLARTFAELATGVSVEPLLQRVIDTPTQTLLDRDQRQRNLKNAFALAAGARVYPGTRYVLVDDVFTTGATLNACAGALRRSGVTMVDVATMGHG